MNETQIAILNTITTALSSLVAALLGAYAVIWHEGQKNRIKWVEEKLLRVEYGALRKDDHFTAGEELNKEFKADLKWLLIPDEGYVGLGQGELAEARKRKGRIAIYCTPVLVATHGFTDSCFQVVYTRPL